MKLFFGIGDNEASSGAGADSCVLNSTITTGTTGSIIKNSVVCNTKCHTINAYGAIIMNCVANSITAQPGSILYNITTTGDIVLTSDQVHVGLYLDGNGEGGAALPPVIHSNLDTDGGVFWEKLALDNTLTFEQIYNVNSTADPAAVEAIIDAKRAEAWAAITAANTK
jgi:hypothetical protein